MDVGSDGPGREIEPAKDNAAPRDALVACMDCGALTVAAGFEVHVQLGIVKGVRCARCIGSADGRVEIIT